MSLTPEDIKDLRRKLSEATPGLWIDMGDTEPWPGTVIATTVPDGGVTPVCIDPEADDRPADRACIAALHNAAPALLDAADALATLRLEHESWGAIIDGLRASLACARQDIDRARSAARIVGFLDAAALIDDESTFDLTTALSEYINLDAMSVDGRARAIGVAEAAVAFAVRAIRAHADHLSKSESAWSES